jgi:hypothetical protein
MRGSSNPAITSLVPSVEPLSRITTSKSARALASTDRRVAARVDAP